MPDESPRPPRRDFLAPALLLLVLAVVALWPGDVSWLMDEPRLIAAAWHANHDGHLVTGGLYGNFGIRYGPLPTQIYQLLLLVTHDPFTLVVLRSLLCAGISGCGLLWLARRLELLGWFAAAVLISPYVVAYQRVLWDASFALPVGVLALAGFADFLRTGRAWSLRLAVLAGVLAPTIHPQALPLAVPVLGWLAWRHRAALWQDRLAFGLLALFVLVLDGFYIVQFTGQLFARLTGSVQHGYPGGESHARAALAPLLGGRLLCGADYLETLTRPGFPFWSSATARAGAWLFYPLAWTGIVIAARGAWRSFRAPEPPVAGSSVAAARDAVMGVVLAGLILQALLFGIMRIPAAPQYFFGTFALHVMAAWFAVEYLRRWKLGVVLGLLYASGGTVLTLEGAWNVHRYGYEVPLWPTLASSVEVARDLNRFADTRALTDVPTYQRAPQALRTLRLLLPPTTEPRPKSHGRLFIAAHTTPKIGDAAVIDLPPDAPPPARSAWIDITPLPDNWVPDQSTW